MKKFRKVDECLMRNDLKAKQRQLVFDPLCGWSENESCSIVLYLWELRNKMNGNRRNDALWGVLADALKANPCVRLLRH